MITGEIGGLDIYLKKSGQRNNLRDFIFKHII